MKTLFSICYYTKVVFYVIVLLQILAFSVTVPIKADDLPPLFLEMHLPWIANSPLSIGEPPEVPND